MDIKEYTSYFHDGYIINIKHMKNQIEFFMESAEIEKELKDEIVLSKNNRIKGKLHVEKIKKIKENDKLFRNLLKMKYKDAEIYPS